MNAQTKAGGTSQAKAMIFSRKFHLAVFCVLLLSVVFILHQILIQSPESPLPSRDVPLNMQPLVYHTEHPRVVQLETRFPGEKLVHLDLKGAPPLVAHFQQMFPILRNMGATGLLIEYEDMFPYSSKLNISALNAYTADDITKLLQSAAAHNLTVIPLIQTFGHMEFVLKLEKFRGLREVDLYPQVVCPTHEETRPLIHAMIDEMLTLHPDVKYIHIGSDEVYYLGQCNRCRAKKDREQWTQKDLFLYHVRAIAGYIKERHPRVRPIMWDDEFREIDKSEILDAEVADLVDIMIWKYTPEVPKYITDVILEKYSQVFSGIWIATAFKGATGPASILPDVRYHLENHRSWMELVNAWHGRLNVKGVALTGWQRYDHFAVLCELWPVGIPSLAVCLRYLDGHVVDDKALTAVLQCSFPFSWAPGEESNFWTNYRCTYPGSPIYHLVNTVYLTLAEIQNGRDTAKGWFTWHQVLHNFSNPAHVMEATNMVDHYRAQVQSLEDDLRREMAQVYDQHTIEEWVGTYLVPIQTKLAAAAKARDRLLEQRTWQRRPLDQRGSDRNLLKGVCDDQSDSLGCVLLGL